MAALDRSVELIFYHILVSFIKDRPSALLCESLEEQVGVEKPP